MAAFDLGPPSPVEIARRALKRLSELGLPPTPENYAAQYCAIAGIPIAAHSVAVATPAQTLELIRTLVQTIAAANDGLHTEPAHFSETAASLMAEAANSHDGSTLKSLYQAMNASSNWLLAQVDEARRELAATRDQLNSVHLELERQQELAVTDGLTALPNRRGILILASKEFARARRSKSTLCLAILDIDHFKNINDEYGHVIGDRALTQFAQTIKCAIREPDGLDRFGRKNSYYSFQTHICPERNSC